MPADSSRHREAAASLLFRRPAADVRPRAVLLFARKLHAEIGKGCAFECLLTGDAELRRLNRQFRNKDEPTDVLSFPGESPKSLGSLAISLARARAQARTYGHSTEDEVRILMLHGLLHLTGLDHETDAGRMAKVEKRWRSRLGLPTGLIERVHV